MEAHQVKKLDLAAIALGIPDYRFSGTAIEEIEITAADLLRKIAFLVFTHALDQGRSQLPTHPPSNGIQTGIAAVPNGLPRIAGYYKAALRRVIAPVIQHGLRCDYQRLAALRMVPRSVVELIALVF